MSVVAPVVEELNEIVRPDGAELVLRAESLTAVLLELDLSRSQCPECVVPKDLVLELVRSKLIAIAPDITTIELIDPREHGRERSNLLGPQRAVAERRRP